MFEQIASKKRPGRQRPGWHGTWNIGSHPRPGTMAQMSSVSTPIPHPGEVLHAAFPVRRGAILIVEDRDDVREGLQQLLELHGFLVFDAADADRAWTHLQADPDGIALMLLDLILPGAMSGRDLRARQLSDSRLAGIPTVVISACEPD